MLRSIVTCAAISIIAVSAPATASPSIIGAWQGPLKANGMECRFGLVLQANREYTSTQQCAVEGLAYPAARQTGTYTITDQNTVVFHVKTWEPKKQVLVGPNGTTTRDLEEPPGGTFAYKFTSSNRTVWRDLSTGASITYTRVP